jgi:hypothetical protein
LQKEARARRLGVGEGAARVTRSNTARMLADWPTMPSNGFGCAASRSRCTSADSAWWRSARSTVSWSVSTLIGFCTKS